MIDRRQLLFSSVAATVGMTSAPLWADTGFPQRRAVDVVFVPTGETYKGFYYWDGSYILPAVQQFSWVCRDYRSNQWKWLNPWLMDLLFVLHWKYDRGQIQVISGYRTPETAAYASQSERDILNSQHVRANALDIRVPGIDSDKLSRGFSTFLGGGVSLFPSLNFVHFDFGPIRDFSIEQPDQQPVSSPAPDEIRLSKDRGIYTVPVLVNRTISLNFVLDSGASDILIPPSLIKKLVTSRTVSEDDFIGNAVYRLADGSTIRGPRFFLRELIVGNQIIRNVQAGLSSDNSPLLLGQSFLSNFKTWTVDNQRHVLILVPKENG